MPTHFFQKVLAIISTFILIGLIGCFIPNPAVDPQNPRQPSGPQNPEPNNNLPLFLGNFSTPVHNSTVNEVPRSISLMFSKDIRIINPVTIHTVASLEGGGRIDSIIPNSRNARRIDIAISGFVPSQVYNLRLSIPRTAFSDASGNNPPDDIVLGFTTSATAVRTQGPVFVSSTPADGASLIDPPPSSVSIMYDKNIRFIDTTGFSNRISVGKPDGITVSSRTERVSVTDNTLTVQIDSFSSEEGRYTLYIPAGRVSDHNNNPAPAVRISFTVGVAPSISNSFPAHDPLSLAESVSPTVTEIVISFDQNIRSTGGRVFLQAVGINPPVSFDLSDASQTTITANTLILHNVVLSPSVTYTVEIPAGSIVDLAGLPFAGGEISFTTGLSDTFAPEFLPSLSTPSEGSTSGAPSTITLAFSENIELVNEASILSSISLSPSEGTRITSAELRTGDTSLLDIAVSGLVTGNYTLRLSAGTIRDTAGNVRNADTELVFIIDATGPILNESDPLFGPRDGVNNWLYSYYAFIYFGEIIRAGVGSITFEPIGGEGTPTTSVDITTLYIPEGAYGLIPNLTPVLAPNTDYRLTIPSGIVEDIYGNPFVGPRIINFRTAPPVN